jgi:predicted phage-related endonuclease
MSSTRRYFNNLEQGTLEWFEARMGIPTASAFKDMMAGGQGKTRRTYMLKLAGEVITGEPQEHFSTPHTERGHEMEPAARELYELQTGYEVKECGFIRHNECGYSPDGLIDDQGLIEIKTKLPHLQIDLLLKGKVPTEHLKQIQGGIMVSGREWCDFISYWPGLPLFVKRVNRDEKIIEEIKQAVDKFNSELNEIIETIGNM